MKPSRNSKVVNAAVEPVQASVLGPVAAVVFCALAGCQYHVVPQSCTTGTGPECCSGPTIPIHIGIEAGDSGTYPYDIRLHGTVPEDMDMAGVVNGTSSNPVERSQDLDGQAPRAGVYSLNLTLVDGRTWSKSFGVECPGLYGYVSIKGGSIGWAVASP
jgi:hypothetical protein